MKGLSRKKRLEIYPAHLPIEYVVLCIDTSHSMLTNDYKPNRLLAAKDAAVALFDRKGIIDPRDRVGLVSFAWHGRMKAPCDSDIKSTLSAINHLDKECCYTDVTDGLKCAVGDLDRFKGVKRIVLLSDGGHNIGNMGVTKTTDPVRYTRDEILKRKIIVDTVLIGRTTVTGMDPGKDEGLLEVIARMTGGTFSYIDSSDGLTRRYRDLAEKKPPPNPSRLTILPGG